MSQTITQEASASVVNTTLNYYLDPSQGGTSFFRPGTAGNYRRKFDERDVDIEDMRKSEDSFQLDRHGFELRKHTSTEKDFSDEDVVKDVVYKEVAELLKEATGATRVHPFSHLVRRQRWEAALDAGDGLPDTANIKLMTPARLVHIDQSYNGAVRFLNDNPPPDTDAATLSKSRWGIINVWRPIHSVVERDPLAVCDARSVSESDLVPMPAVLPSTPAGTYENVSAKDRTPETWSIKGNPAHKWYYASELSPEEVLLIKCFDSKEDGRARRCPHTSFADPRTAEGPSPPRESIEVRCLVFWGDQEAK